MPRSVRAVSENMLDLDPPQHTRLRSLVQRAFTPSRVAMIRARIEALTHELIDGVVSRREMDVISLRPIATHGNSRNLTRSM